MKNQKDYNKIVNISNENEITIIDHVFKHNDFKGATGSKYFPVTEHEIQDRIRDYEDNNTELLIYFAENYGKLNREMIEGLDSSREALIELFFDSCINPIHEEEIRKHFSESDYPVIDCVRVGRCFEKDFQGNVNPKLSEIIREYEAK